MRKTKIVATVGPASETEAMLERFVGGAVDAVRVNFSHGSREQNCALIRRIRDISARAGREVAVIQDLCGPKIRTGDMKDGGAFLAAGTEVVITVEPRAGTAETFSVNYPGFAADVKPGARVLLDDGALELTVTSVDDGRVTCAVVHGGVLKSHKGVNLPGTAVSLPSVTEKDIDDLAAGIDAGIDFAALSFVREAEDLEPVRDIITRRGSTAQVIAKMEKPEALENLDAIVRAADGILVARGDLGVEMDLRRVTLLQKDMIRRANEQDKYVITATQMLESMINSPRPTRAEVADVSNAILDGTDAVMLSGETAVGRYPLEAVAMMDGIARETEAYLAARCAGVDWSRINDVNPVQDAVGRAVYNLARDLDAAAIVAYSATGGTAVYLSKNRPGPPIVVFTTNIDALRRMRLYWGVVPVYEEGIASRDDLLRRGRAFLDRHPGILHVAEDGKSQKPTSIILVAGSRFGQVGSTDTVEVVSLN